MPKNKKYPSFPSDDVSNDHNKEICPDCGKTFISLKHHLAYQTGNRKTCIKTNLNNVNSSSTNLDNSIGPPIAKFAIIESSHRLKYDSVEEFITNENQKKRFNQEVIINNNNSNNITRNKRNNKQLNMDVNNSFTEKEEMFTHNDTTHYDFPDVESVVTNHSFFNKNAKKTNITKSNKKYTPNKEQKKFRYRMAATYDDDFDIDSDEEEDEVNFVSASFGNIAIDHHSLIPLVGEDISVENMLTIKENSINELLNEINDDSSSHLIIDKDDEIYDWKPENESIISYCIIYDVLNKAHVPLYMYDMIMKVIIDEIKIERLNIHTEFMTRHHVLNYMQENHQVPPPVKTVIALECPLNKKEMPKIVAPEHIDVHNYSGKEKDTVEIIWFDFQKQLEDILQDVELFSNMDNLVVNKNVETDHDKRWLPYEPSPNGTIFETLDGNWYQNYARNQITDPNRQFIIPIGCYIDASQCVTYQRYSFQPLMFYPLILSCKARNYPRSSRVLAFIPDLEAGSSAKKTKQKRGHKMNNSLPVRNYHRCLEVALASYKKVQDAGGFNTYLRLGNQVRKKMILVPLAFISGDAKSQDMLTCRYGTHNGGRMCRACDVSFIDSDAINYKCNWFRHNHFNRWLLILYNECSTNEEKDNAYKILQQNSQHICHNAFQDLDFAGFERGIFGCTPHDMMHCFQHGVLKYATRIFIHSFTDSEKAKIDELIETVFYKFCSSESKNMLRYNFNKGMTNMTMITADEEVGQALVLLIIGQMDKGNRILKNRVGYDEPENNNNNVLDNLADNIADVREDNLDEPSFVDYNVAVNIRTDKSKKLPIIVTNNDSDDESVDAKDINVECDCTFKNFIQCIEQLLAFHAWYKSTKPFIWNKLREQQALRSIRTMLKLLKSIFPRESGNGWRLQKFHELLHLPYDISNFGSAKNFDTGIMENRLIHVGKHNAKLTQKRGPKIFTEQLANRLHEQMLFCKTCRNFKINHGSKNDDKKWNDDEMLSLDDLYEEDYSSNTLIDLSLGMFCLKKEKPDYEIIFNKLYIDGYDVESNIKTLNKNNIPKMISKTIAEYLMSVNETSAKCYTYANFFPTNSKNESMRKSFRCHPNYNKKQWFDWCVVNYGEHIDVERNNYNKENNKIPAYPMGQYPCKVLCFFKVGDQTEINVLVHATTYKVHCAEDSVLTEVFYLDYDKLPNFIEKTIKKDEKDKGIISNATITVIDIKTISDSCYVVQESPGLLPVISSIDDDTNQVILVKHRSTWGKCFT